MPHHAQNLAPGGYKSSAQLGQTTILAVGQPELKPDFFAQTSYVGQLCELVAVALLCRRLLRLS